MKKRYIKYAERILHEDVESMPFDDMGKLPLYLQSGYSLSRIVICGCEVLAAEPASQLSLIQMRKNSRQLEIHTGLKCVLCLENLNYYSRDVMIREGIPFIWAEHQLYLPFIGVLLNECQRDVHPCEKISFLTQKLLLSALYHNWQKVSVTKASEMLGVSKMSVTRCFDELEAKNVKYLNIKHRARNISAGNDKKTMWEDIRPVLRNPVISTIYLKEIPEKQLPYSGISALSYYSLLAEGSIPVYAMSKKDRNIVITSKNLKTFPDEAVCAVQQLGYFIPFGDGTAIDPLTAALCINEEEFSDPRVQLAIDEMLKENVW